MVADVAVAVDPNPLRVQLKEGSPELLIEFRVQATVSLASILAAATQAKAHMAEGRDGGSEVVSSPLPLDYTALCVGGFPGSWNEAQVRQAHKQIGMADRCLAEVRAVAQKLAGDTGCAIFRYVDENSAAEALTGLNGMEVATPGGHQGTLRAQYADAATAGTPSCATTGIASRGGGGGTIRSTPTASPNDAVVRATACGAADGFVPVTPIAAAAPPTVWPTSVVLPAPGMRFRETASTVPGVSASACTPAPAFSSRSLDGKAEYADLPSVYVSDLPADVTEDSIRHILCNAGLDPGLLVSVKVLPPTVMVNSTCAVLRYASPATLANVVAALQGHQLHLPNGEVRVLHAKLADPPKFLSSTVSSGCNSNDSSALSPDIYLSEVPLGWSEDHVKELHRSVGFDPVAISGVEMLLGDSAESTRGTAVIRYSDQSAASAAMQMLQGKVAALADGERQLNVRPDDVPGKYTKHVREARKVSTRIFMALDDEIQRVAGGWSRAHENFVNRADDLSAALGEQQRARVVRLEELRNFQQQCHHKLERLGLPLTPQPPSYADAAEQ